MEVKINLQFLSFLIFLSSIDINVLVSLFHISEGSEICSHLASLQESIGDLMTKVKVAVDSLQGAQSRL